MVWLIGVVDSDWLFIIRSHQSGVTHMSYHRVDSMNVNLREFVRKREREGDDVYFIL